MASSLGASASGDSADPRSTGAFKAARVQQLEDETPARSGCGGCLAALLKVCGRLLGLALLALTLPGAWIVGGWSVELARRAAYWRFWRLQPEAYRGGGFGVFAITRGCVPPPWIPHLFRDWRVKAGWQHQLGGFWRHARTGVTLWLHSLIAYAPVAILWLLAHRSGWTHTFYERPLGPGAGYGYGGIAAFAVIMRWLPVMQARFAFTGDWRVFYQYRFSWQLVGYSMRDGNGLAVLYLVAVVPYGLALAWIGLLAAHLPADAPAAVFVWWWRCGQLGLSALVVAAWICLRLAGVWVYPHALHGALADGGLTPDQLHPAEQDLIRTLAWIQPPCERQPPMLRLLMIVGQLAIWALVSMHLFVGARHASTTVWTWWQHPAIHAPWYSLPGGRLAKPPGDAGADPQMPGSITGD